MGIMDWAAWSLIAGLSFISIGGLLIWTYGDSINAKQTLGLELSEQASIARKRYAGLLIYGVVLIVLGLGCLFQGSLFLIGNS